MASGDWTPFDPGRLPLLGATPSGEGNVVVILATPATVEDAWAIGVAVALADGYSEEGRRVVLVDADLDFPSLHERMQAENAEGVVDLVDFGASERRVVRLAPGKRYQFVSAGAFAIDPEEVLGSDQWRGFCERRVAEGATLVVFSETTAPGARSLLRLATDIVVLAEKDEHVEPALHRYESLVRAVCGPGTPADDPLPIPPEKMIPGGAEPEEAGRGAGIPRAPGREPEPRLGGGFDTAPKEPAATGNVPGSTGRRSVRRWTAAVLVAVLVLIAAWRLGFVELPVLPLSPAEDPPSPTEPSMVDEAEDAAERTSTLELEAGAERRPPVEGGESPGSLPVGPSILFAGRDVASGGLAHVLQVASYVDPAEARATLDVLREASAAPGLLVPVRVRGTTYYRVLLGPFQDSATARSVQDSSPGGSGWLVRRAPLSFLLGETLEQAAAARRVTELGEIGIPSYSVAVAFVGGGVAYRIYSGAHATGDDAGRLAEILSESGLGEAPLVRTVGSRR